LRSSKLTSDIDEVLFECFIPGRVGIKKNGRKARRFGHRIFTVASDSFEQWACDASVHIKMAARGMKPISFPVVATMIFRFPDHRGEPDLSNAYQGVEDLLQEMGVIENDRLIYSHDGSRKVFGQPFSTHIILTKYPGL
jgi:Holliday junction resolvase RusA-like endonuclease